MGLASFFGVVFFGFVIYQATTEWMKNERAPIQSASAVVFDKRRKTCRRRSNGYVFHSPTYHVVFVLENSERKELRVCGDEYERLSTGDKGNLQFKGTKYLTFERLEGRKNV